MLQAEDLNVYYGSIHAIQGVSFTVNKGEIVTLIGANGAGKSTTLNTVSGLLRSKTGSLTFKGESIAGMAPHTVVRKGIIHVPEGRRIFSKLGGEQQMLAIGRALVSRPSLLMLDEPSMGLAPILVEQVFSIIQEIHRSGVTVLLVEQNARMALSIADRGYVLETGRVVLTGPGKELLANDSVRKAYLGS